ncbi:MAG: hypothetical protein ACPGXI_10880 [Mycobacterium sp.]
MAAPTFTLTTGDGFAARIGTTREELAGAKLTFRTNVTLGGMVVIDDGMELIDKVVVTLDENGKINGDNGVVLLANDDSLNLSSPLEWQVSFSGVTNRGFEKVITPWSFDAPGDGESINLTDVMPPPGQLSKRGPAASIVSGYFDDNDDLVLVNRDGSYTTPIELPDDTIAFVGNGDGTVQVG